MLRLAFLVTLIVLVGCSGDGNTGDQFQEHVAQQIQAAEQKAGGFDFKSAKKLLNELRNELNDSSINVKAYDRLIADIDSSFASINKEHSSYRQKVGEGYVVFEGNLVPSKEKERIVAGRKHEAEVARQEAERARLEAERSEQVEAAEAAQRIIDKAAREYEALFKETGTDALWGSKATKIYYGVKVRSQWSEEVQLYVSVRNKSNTPTRISIYDYGIVDENGRIYAPSSESTIYQGTKELYGAANLNPGEGCLAVLEYSMNVPKGTKFFFPIPDTAIAFVIDGSDGD